ncbi:MAG TPA: hypothetical protein VHZ55_22220 [Bryobacteraceae bacterium]|jgi:hypothetical protein|nr:hypothetical protein [Bryobacteraceae bacterium]
MTLNDLQQWRKKVPYFIAAACVVPWFLFRSKSLADAVMPIQVLVPTVAVLIAFLYVNLKLREPMWKREKQTYVGTQIRNSLMTLIPNDLEITPGEREQLAKSEIYKKLTGVFWQAVDESDLLRAHKEHFYSNGIEYTTTIDAFLMCGFFGFCYAIASLMLSDVVLACVAAVLIAIALVCKFVGIPRARRHHLDLSNEQLELLRRERGDFVVGRFRDIVLGWRRGQMLS